MIIAVDLKSLILLWRCHCNLPLHHHVSRGNLAQSHQLLLLLKGGLRLRMALLVQGGAPVLCVGVRGERGGLKHALRWVDQGLLVVRRQIGAQVDRGIA